MAKIMVNPIRIAPLAGSPAWAPHAHALVSLAGSMPGIMTASLIDHAGQVSTVEFTVVNRELWTDDGSLHRDWLVTSGPFSRARWGAPGDALQAVLEDVIRALDESSALADDQNFLADTSPQEEAAPDSPGEPYHVSHQERFGSSDKHAPLSNCGRPSDQPERRLDQPQWMRKHRHRGIVFIAKSVQFAVILRRECF